MKWFEYKAEVDALHAPDDLKARLRAMKESDTQDAAPAAAGQPAKPAKASRRKRAVRFPLKRIAGMAACFVCGMGVMLAGVTAMSSGMFRMGSSSASSMAMAADTNGKATAGGTSYGMEAAESFTDSSDQIAYDSFAGNGAAASEKDANLQGAGTRSTTRKIIYTANLTLEATDYDATIAALQQALTAAGGYVESSESYNCGTNDRIVNYTLRIPAENYQSFLTGAEGAGNLVEKSEDSNDITAAYVDVAARIDALTTQRTRLLELEQQAGDLSDLLEIENQLSQVQYELESYQRKLAVYDDLVAYCTVKLSVYEVTVYTPVKPSAGQQLLNALTGGLVRFGDAMFDFVLWVLSSLPWLVLLTVLFGTTWFVRRKRKDRT